MPLVKRVPRKFITASQAAKLLSYHPQTIRRLRAAGKFQGYRNVDAGPTTPWMFAEREILAYREKRFAAV